MLEPLARSWRVSALCKALADALEARFNPVTVQGELTGFTRASSGHCYFSIKDAQAQLRCVMFKRAAGQLDFVPRDGQLVELRGRVTLYEPRGDLQLMVESMRPAGAGALFEQFLQLKAKLESEGLFDTARKRQPPPMPRGIGVVTSLSAAALRDVVTTLQRRAPHIPVWIAPAAVQGSGAAGELVKALDLLFQWTGASSDATLPCVDVIVLARGGGSLEDLWAFNDEALVRTIARSPVPVISGVGHETDFTLADFVADLRAPTPTAAAELAALTRQSWLDLLDQARVRLDDLAWRHVDLQTQRLDGLAARLGRPSTMVLEQRFHLSSAQNRLQRAARDAIEVRGDRLDRAGRLLPGRVALGLERRRARLQQARLRLELLDPGLVLQRGYAWIVDTAGHTVLRPSQGHPGDILDVRLAFGGMKLQVPEQG